MTTSPCDGCQDRHIGCHADCKGFLAWDAERSAFRALKRKADEQRQSVTAYKRETPARKRFLRGKK